MAQRGNREVIVIGTGHTPTNHRPEVSLYRRANDSGKPRQWRHGEHPEAIRYEPGQEPPPRRTGHIAGPSLR
jgi:hypothetical protein